ncbi:hypothetical protein [Streptacidiphilus fuscans]|uniref:hypothetical protein n=1 Tax=Streptacidiphilus fuscans TaxID=2789292 RepID=UPI001F37D252|nr:hypothetical protein [Streptacidiphilus fuscans]
MSLDPFIDPLFLTSAAAVGLAGARVLWTALRAAPRRPGHGVSTDGKRTVRSAIRLLLGALIFALVLAAVATFRWSDATITGGATGDASFWPPPLLAFLSLPATALPVLVIGLRCRSGRRSRLDIRPHTDLEQRSVVRLVMAHGVRVPRPRVPAGDALRPEAVPSGCGDRPDDQRHARAGQVA